MGLSAFSGLFWLDTAVLIRYLGITPHNTGYNLTLEFARVFRSRRKAMDFLAASIGREFESYDCSSRDELGIESCIATLEKCGHASQNFIGIHTHWVLQTNRIKLPVVKPKRKKTRR